MRKTSGRHEIDSAVRFFVLDHGTRFSKQLGLSRTCSISRLSLLDGALLRSSKESLWIVMRAAWTERLLGAATSLSLQRHGRRHAFGDLLMLQPTPHNESIPSLHSCFRRVVGEVPSFKLLPLDQLAEVLVSESRRDLFIGGIVDRNSKTLTLARGDLETLTVPLALFRAAGPSQPDFDRFAVDDYGYALRFGDYEASAHFVLYAVDPDYRRKANATRRSDEQGFGPSLRRLRLLRGLGRNDFPGITAKTIARIERGETEEPHGSTLNKLAAALNVEPGEIETY